MLLIAEFLLTIFAWRNGWKWLSLLPLGIAMLMALCIGLGVGSAGGDVNSMRGLTVFLDFGAIIALVVMVCKKPKSIETPKV